MTSNAEELKDLIAKKKEFADKARREFEFAQKQMSTYANEVRYLENELAKVEIAELGEWRPPANDAYWQRAVVRKEPGTKAESDFTYQAFDKAGLFVVGIVGVRRVFGDQTKYAQFQVLGFGEGDFDTEELRPKILNALKIVAELYPADRSDGFASLTLGNIKDERAINDTNNPFEHEDAETDIEVLISKTENLATFDGQKFTGENYLEDLCEEVLRERAAMLEIPYQRPLLTTIRRP